MKIFLLKINWLLLILFSAVSFLSGLAQTATPPAPSLNIPALPKVQSQSQTKLNSLFLNVLASRLATINLTVETFCPQDNILTKRILKDYGAVFVGNGLYSAPCYFRDDNVTLDVQNRLGITANMIGGVRIELQPAAMAALLKAVAEAKSQGLNITPRGGSIAGRRSFSATLGLWNRNVSKGLAHWVRLGKLTREQAQTIPRMEIMNQVALILELEDQGIYFSTNFDKSILYSVAAPGTSQHNLMLAFDVTQFANPRVRQILATNGWFQTVASDLPHFTYLGVTESQLPSLGLRSVSIGNQIFWIPQM
jgi:hypothetical protein